MTTAPRTTSMSSPRTAEHLANTLGGKTSHWEIWLANERRPGRVNRQLTSEPGPGRPRYAKDRIDTFVSAYIAKQAELKAQAEIKQPVGRDKRFAAHISAATFDEGVEIPFILLTTVSPLRSYQLTAAEARSIARRLMNAADEIDPQPAQTQPHGISQR